MSMIGKVSTGDYEPVYKEKLDKLNREIKQAILHNVWSYLYYTYGGPNQDKDHGYAIRIISNTYHRKY